MCKFPYNTVLLKLTLASDGSPVLVGEATFPYNTVLLKHKYPDSMES